MRAQIFLAALLPVMTHGFIATLPVDVSGRCRMPIMKDITVKFPGGKQATVPSGSPLSLAAYKAGAQITYQCKAGTCASCEVKVGGSPVRACQAKVKAPFWGDTVTVSAKPGSATRL